MSTSSHSHPLLSKEEEAAELEQASFEVDESLIRWSLGLSIRDRLRAATRVARMLGRFHGVSTPRAG